MKKLMLIGMVLLFAICESSFAQNPDFESQEVPRIYWKHHNCSWPGGLCIRHIFPIFRHTDELQPGEGTFNYDLVEEKFRVVFNGTGGPVDNIFSVDDGVIIPKELAGTLGYNTIILKGGDYKVDYSNPKLKFGFVLIDCEKVK